MSFLGSGAVASTKSKDVHCGVVHAMWILYMAAEYNRVVPLHASGLKLLEIHFCVSNATVAQYSRIQDSFPRLNHDLNSYI